MIISLQGEMGKSGDRGPEGQPGIKVPVCLQLLSRLDPRRKQEKTHKCCILFRQVYLPVLNIMFEYNFLQNNNTYIHHIGLKRVSCCLN